ncbi:MAG: nitrile hydratase accessory protein [Hyphomicrobiales bacterium]|nr:nitrile hydratase accessory protein [Hyphomicrobiales bacterium]
MSDLPLDRLPALPRDADGPVFAAPWQAQAFAMAVALNARGHFTWPEWVETFAAELAAGDPPGVDPADAYYHHWLAALEKIVAAKGLAPAGEQDRRRAAWAAAVARTPHGRPIELGPDD